MFFVQAIWEYTHFVLPFYNHLKNGGMSVEKRGKP
jgi:hypothetical protein